MSITRYTLRTRRDTDGIHADAIEAPSGKYVTHEDHIASLLRVKNEWGTDQAFRMAEANAKDAEIARLNAENKLIRGAMASDDRRLLEAGQRVGIINGCDTPDTMADEIESLRKQAQRRDAEIAALRERCGRLANEVMAWRRHDAAFTLIVGVAEVNRLLSFDTFYRTSGEVCEAMQQVKDHNDLAPPKGDNDG